MSVSTALGRKSICKSGFVPLVVNGSTLDEADMRRRRAGNARASSGPNRWINRVHGLEVAGIKSSFEKRRRIDWLYRRWPRMRWAELRHDHHYLAVKRSLEWLRDDHAGRKLA
jgi:hypothetical protein